MKIVFLDFDGVCNGSLLLESFLTFNNYPDLLPENCRLVNEIIKYTGAKIVISSDWRNYLSVEFLQDYLKKHGINGEIIGMTRRYDGSMRREEEIEHWLDNHKWSNFVILDDIEMKELRESAIHTDSCYGINVQEAHQAINILNRLEKGIRIKSTEPIGDHPVGEFCWTWEESNVRLIKFDNNDIFQFKLGENK